MSTLDIVSFIMILLLLNQNWSYLFNNNLILLIIFIDFRFDNIT